MNFEDDDIFALPLNLFLLSLSLTKKGTMWRIIIYISYILNFYLSIKMSLVDYGFKNIFVRYYNTIGNKRIVFMVQPWMSFFNKCIYDIVVNSRTGLDIPFTNKFKFFPFSTVHIEGFSIFSTNTILRVRLMYELSASSIFVLYIVYSIQS